MSGPTGSDLRSGTEPDGPGEVIGGWAYDVTTEEIRWCPRMFEIYGLPPDHAVTLEMLTLTMLDGAGDALARERRSWRTSVAPFRARSRIVRGDGVVRTIEASGWRDPFTRDDAPRVVGTARDVTDEPAALREGAVVEAQERARRRIAAAVHDDAIAAIDAAALRLDAARGQLAGGERLVEESVTGLREAAERLRLVLGDLMPPVGVGSLRSAVETYAATLFAAGDARVEVCGDAGELDDESRLVAYRAIQEALRNAHRHANARRISVEIARRGPVLVIAVRDDGIGLSVPGRSSSLTHGGLRLLADQVEAVAGVLRLGEGRDGRGTCVEVELPVCG